MIFCFINQLFHHSFGSRLYNRFTLHTVARYRSRSDKFQGGDILLVAKVTENDADLPLMAEDVILGIQRALEELVEDLNEEYDQMMEQMIYMEVHSATFPVPQRLGSFELHGKLDVVDLTMTNLSKVLQSYTSARDNKAQLEFQFTILSKRHATELRERRKRGQLPVNVFEPEDDSWGL